MVRLTDGFARGIERAVQREHVAGMLSQSTSPDRVGGERGRARADVRIAVRALFTDREAHRDPLRVGFECGRGRCALVVDGGVDRTCFDAADLAAAAVLRRRHAGRKEQAVTDGERRVLAIGTFLDLADRVELLAGLSSPSTSSCSRGTRGIATAARMPRIATTIMSSIRVETAETTLTLLHVPSSGAVQQSACPHWWLYNFSDLPNELFATVTTNVTFAAVFRARVTNRGACGSIGGAGRARPSPR